MIEVFGIKNCDTMKKAFRWLEENKVEYRFHDYKKEGLDAELASNWIATLGWENVINKRGTTWRKLDDETKNTMNAENAVQLMITQTSIVKRPVIVSGETKLLGFNPDDYAKHLL
ncbi:ArsC family reductase [Marinomonas algarum]|uniref:ArsC family reductase n=1 Tax=Marinomonas algarum TaxID=2883105 RepID=A0A9X1ILW9_9GAMM|nr:ArsC family reductase [Marinomonas algarum]MCB5161640.1 ArsC family reductase [Marinomonas algarum]